MRCYVRCESHILPYQANSTIDAEASAKSARMHFDKMQMDLQATGCDIFYYVAAYSADHDPVQCQYFSNKYRYIDRAATLAQHLSDLVGEMASGVGFVKLVAYQIHRVVGVGADGRALVWDFFG